MNPLVRRLGITLGLVVVLFGISRGCADEPTPEPSLKEPAPLLNPTITVRLMSLSGRSAVDLEVMGRFRLRDGDDPSRVLLTERSSFQGQLLAHETGPQLGPYQTLREHVVLETEGDDALRIDTLAYPGRLHIRSRRDDRGLITGLDLSLELSLEEYVLGVVCGEMPSQREGAQEALRAQAVAARTYALEKRGRKRALRDDTFDQVFRGSDYHTWQAREAVEATQGLVLRHEDGLVPAYFHRNCGGGTANAFAAGFHREDIAPLAGTFEPACRTPRGIWDRRIEAADLDALAKRYGLGKWLREINTIERDASGRLLEVRLVGEEDHKDLAAERLRAALHLPSSQLVEARLQEDGAVIFRGHGYGHGVGLCQEGTLRSSKSGNSFREILEHYYPGAEVVALTSDLEFLLPPSP